MCERTEIPLLYYFSSPLTDPHSTAILRRIPLEDLCLLTLFQHMIEKKMNDIFPFRKEFSSKGRFFCETSSHGFPLSAALVYFSVQCIKQAPSLI